MSQTKIFDVVTIGGGIIGCSIARSLSKYNLSHLVVDSLADVGMGTTKANSGIVHAGFHTTLDTLKGQLVHHGNRLIHSLHKDLGFGYKQSGELVVAKDESDWEKIEEIKKIAESKGIPIEMWDQKTLQREEPNLSKNLLGALFGPTGGVINPYEFAFALRELSEQNGTVFQTSTQVTSIDILPDQTFLVHTTKGDIGCQILINAAGLFSDKIANMVNDYSFSIHPRKGEEYLLDKSFSNLFHHVIFPVGTKTSKGTLLIPTVDQTLMVGPSADETDDRWDLTTSSEGVAKIFEFAEKYLSPKISQRAVIAQFAGLRAASNTGDFIIEKSKVCKHFYNVGGIQSPGLTAAPAIGEYVLNLLKQNEKSYNFVNEKTNYHPILPTPMKLFMNMTPEEQEKIVEKDPRYGDVVCRCEFVTVGDIQSAIDHGATTMDGVKFRTRAGMGKCQGGFCSSRIMEMLAHRQNVPIEEISKFGKGSKLISHAWEDPRRSKEKQKSILKKRWEKEEKKEEKIISKENIDKGKELKKHLEENVYDVAVIGGGAAGLAAARGAKEMGAEKVVVFDREPVPGGILLQCIHSGFGLKHFKEELTGPEYADRVNIEARESGAEIYPSSFVYELKKDPKTEEKNIRVLIGSELGGTIANVKAKSIVLAMGCRERTRAEIKIPGSRPAGVYNAGLAQKMINEMGVLPGKKAVILGSGDIGLIMARRLVLEGCQVQGVFELLPNCSGLKRNVVQCLDDYGIPLKLSHTVVKIHGKDRLEKVTIAPVDPITFVPKMDQAFDVECDLLLLSVGLIPNNDVAENIGLEINPTTKGAKVTSEMMTNVDGVFSAGNVLHVHDIVDNVTQEGIKAGKAAVMYLKSKEEFHKSNIKFEAGPNVGYVVPEKLSTSFIKNISNLKEMPYTVSLRSRKIMRNVELQLVDKLTGEVILKKKESLVLPAEMIIFELKKKQIEKLEELSKKYQSNNVEIIVQLTELPQKEEKKKSSKKIEGIESAEKTNMTCIGCPEGCLLTVYYKGPKVIHVEGNKCKVGLDYAKQEFVDPRRIFSTTITSVDEKTPEHVNVIPVKLSKPVPKPKILEIVKEIQKVKFDSDVKCGDILVKDIAGEKGCDLIACRSAKLVKL